MNAIRLEGLKRIAKELGCTVECDSGGRYEVYQICAPDGFVFCDNGSVHLKIEWIPGSAETVHESVRDGLERLTAGIRRMTDRERFEAGQ